MNYMENFKNMESFGDIASAYKTGEMKNFLIVFGVYSTLIIEKHKIKLKITKNELEAENHNEITKFLNEIFFLKELVISIKEN